jgi:hypothetical protein
MSARGEIDQSEAVVALRDLLAATERHVFGDECLEERDAARRALTAPPSRGAPGPTAMFHLAVATLERGAAIDQLTDDEIAVIVSAVLAGIENNRAHTDAQRVAELEAALEPFATHYVDDSEIDDDEADFDGHSLLVKNFRTARTALAAIREQHTPTATQPAPRHKS